MTRPTYMITTAIPYANGAPHIGHAYERVATDAFARWKRLDGFDVLFVTGMDEHGQKMQRTAEKEGLTPQALALGRYAYQRKSGDVEVRMSVENAGGAKTWEASRFLGRAPSANSPDPAELEKRRADLQAEVDRLRRENAAQAAKIQQLERTLRVLETRLGIEKQ